MKLGIRFYGQSPPQISGLLLDDFCCLPSVRSTATLDFSLYLTLPCHQSSPPVPRFIVNRRRTSLHRLPRQPPHLAISVAADFLSSQAALCRRRPQIHRLPVFLTGRLTSTTLLQQISSPAAAPLTSRLT
ncbi:hypothetical protein ACOSP7_026560 [Xanthoceras sorbifolium]